MAQTENQTSVSILRNQPPLVNMLFIELLHQSISERITLDTLSERDNLLAALDARLQFPSRAEESTSYLVGPRSPLPIYATQNTPSLMHHITIPRRETPHWVPAQAEKTMLLKEQHPRPTRQANNLCADRLLLYLIVTLIAIPTAVLSWAPMTVKLIIGSAITIFFGYRLAVAFPVLTLLNPILPLGDKPHREPKRPCHFSGIRL